MQLSGFLYGFKIPRREEKYAAGSAVRSQKAEAWRKVSFNGSLSRYQYDLPREAGNLSQIFNDRTAKCEAEKRLYGPV